MSDTSNPDCPHCQGVPPSTDGKTECGWCTPDHVPSVVPDRSWVREDFDEWSELTKERDGYRADAEAEWHRRDLYG